MNLYGVGQAVAQFILQCYNHTTFNKLSVINIMNTQALLEAVNQICMTRGINPEDVFTALKEAIIEAYTREHEGADVTVDINKKQGSIHIYVRKKVVKKVKNPDKEITIKEARKYVKDIKEGAILEIEIPVGTLGRIAANITKRTLNRVLLDAELKAAADHYSQYLGQAVSGKILFLRKDRIVVELEKGNADFPKEEQIESEFYELGRRYKFLVKEIINEKFNRRIILSRKAPEFISALFKLEVPELRNGKVDIVKVARIPGRRSKVAVKALETGIDPVGTLIGPKGMRIAPIMRELPNESIDVVKWDVAPATYIANALAPAKVAEVEINDKKKQARVIVPDDQYDVAVGRDGLNVRLAEMLTGYEIDITLKNGKKPEVKDKDGTEKSEKTKPEKAEPKVAESKEAKDKAGEEK